MGNVVSLFDSSSLASSPCVKSVKRLELTVEGVKIVGDTAQIAVVLQQIRVATVRKRVNGRETSDIRIELRFLRAIVRVKWVPTIALIIFR